MKLSPADLRELAAVATEAATEAGQMISRSRPQDIERKASGYSPASDVVTEIDRRSEDIILGILSPTLDRFELGLLTEERVDDGGRLTADNFWCIDPLDGTLPFIEGVSGYAVSIALIGRDGTPLIGVTYDPVGLTLTHAIFGGGAFRDGRPWSVNPLANGDALTVFADRSFMASDDHEPTLAALKEIAHDMGLIGVQLHGTSGAVMNALGVLNNPPACYFKFPGPTGGGSLWDFAATACVFREAAAVATDIRGAPLDLNRADSSFMNHRGVLFASNEALAARIRSLWPGASS